MEEKIKQGDLVQSLSGRDKGGYFAVINADGDCAYIANGKERKVNSVKKKNIKHLKLVKRGALVEQAKKIFGGECVGNKTLARAIAEQQKRQEE